MMIEICISTSRRRCSWLVWTCYSCDFYSGRPFFSTVNRLDIWKEWSPSISQTIILIHYTGFYYCKRDIMFIILQLTVELKKIKCFIYRLIIISYTMPAYTHTLNLLLFFQGPSCRISNLTSNSLSWYKQIIYHYSSIFLIFDPNT